MPFAEGLDEPGLMDGPAIWETVADLRGFGRAKRTADWLDQPSEGIARARAAGG
jgi:hypothetical protein